jgi:CxxC motif-containing protein (DUF1111 family)
MPAMRTARFDIALPDGTRQAIWPISFKTAALFSDLLLHDMGPTMDEAVTMRQARGSEFRTAPLWGLRLRTRFLHDGRAASVHDAISAHGGEGQIIRDRYLALTEAEQNAVLAFLSKL